MSEIVTLKTMPPEIKQDFDAILLRRAAPKLCEDSADLDKIYEYVSYLAYKFRKCPKKWEKFETLRYRYRYIYGEIRKQEKILKKETGYSVKMSFYWHRIPDKGRGRVFEMVKQKARRYKSKAWLC